MLARYVGCSGSGCTISYSRTQVDGRLATSGMGEDDGERVGNVKAGTTAGGSLARGVGYDRKEVGSQACG